MMGIWVYSSPFRSIVLLQLDGDCVVDRVLTKVSDGTKVWSKGQTTSKRVTPLPGYERWKRNELAKPGALRSLAWQ
jgi:hypothetical protein